MIEVTCEQCGVAYRVEERLLGAEGRMVRCMDCKHTWMQPSPLPAAEEVAAIEDAPPEQAPPDWMQEEEQGEAFDLVTKEKGKYFHESEMDIPDAVKPAPQKAPELPPQPFQIPVMDYRPLGMASGQFGACVFLLLLFATLIPLFVAKRAVVNHMPSMAHFYKSIGFDLKAPGEGLQLAEVTAENRVQGKDRLLALQAKVTNTTAAPVAQPSLRVQLKGAYGAVLKKWEFSPEKDTDIAAGESVPLDISFRDPPPDGKTVELQVIDK